MNLLTGIIARILYAVPFIFFGLSHLMKGEDMAKMIPSWVPLKLILNYIVGLSLVAAGTSIIFKKYASLATLLLGIELIIFMLVMHAPNLSDPQMGQLSMMMLLKDMSLAGAAFYMSGVFKKEEA